MMHCFTAHILHVNNSYFLQSEQNNEVRPDGISYPVNKILRNSVGLMLASVVDSGPTLNQQWFSVSCSLGISLGISS